MSWGKTPLYLSSWNFIYFWWKEPIKVQIWWNFAGALRSLKFSTLVGSFCKNHTKFQLKMYRRLITHDIEEWCKAKKKKKMTCGFKLSPNHPRVQQFYFDGLFLSKVYEVWAKKIQRSYLSWHWTVMQNWNKPWPCSFKNGMRNWVNLH